MANAAFILGVSDLAVERGERNDSIEIYARRY